MAMRGGVSRGGPVPTASNMMQRPAPAAPGLQLPVQRNAAPVGAQGAFNAAGGGMAKAGPGAMGGGMMGSVGAPGGMSSAMSGGLQGAMQGGAPQAGGMMGTMGGAMGSSMQPAPGASSQLMAGSPPAALISALRGRMGGGMR